MAAHSPGDFTIVGIGASAGGLDACRHLLRALPAHHGMAFILVQHLDPTHESMMVDLLSGYTPMVVEQAVDGTLIERGHLYVIPPGTYLAVDGGTLRLSQPQARHGARLPFDFLLHSLAEACGVRAICVVLSGTGSDGSLGLKSIRDRSGLVIAQDPDEAAFNGMPRSAIMTGAVDLVLPVGKIPFALADYDRRMSLIGARDGPDPSGKAQEALLRIVDLLRTKTAHNFTLYKQGTLQRRIARRMAMAAVETDDMDRYFEILRADAAELDLLAKDLLIHVTSFFRDPNVFDHLAEDIFPALVRSHSPGHPIRVWIAGCSSGEETYSLAMLFHEAIAASGLNVKLQVFASDVDPGAVASARDGLYPETIAADVSPERLARFFSKEDHSYRVLPDLRSSVVFAVQDLLADPPFSRIDFISCRNLLIYLLPEAQAKVIALFHFALRDGGLLLLGSAETAGNAGCGFDVLSKADRLYRHVGRNRPGDLHFPMNPDDGVRVPVRVGQRQPPSRQAALAELCRRLVIDAFAPAAVLINRNLECLYYLGPTDRYLRIASGQPSHELLSMARNGLRTKLMAAIHQARQDNVHIVASGGRIKVNDNTIAFNIDVQPIENDGEQLLLVCFVDEPARPWKESKPGTPGGPLVAELRHELAITKSELQGAVRSLEIANAEQKAINDEALSVNEEYQSTNEELLTSKEELQSLNEELTALNGQLHETLERQRTTSNDLENVLNSTEVATLFLDPNLTIRFFTPATKSLFSVLPGDVGRPLADLSSLAADTTLLTDAGLVLKTFTSLDREIEARTGTWYVRRILPYRTREGSVEGVVITFTDITERKNIATVLEEAKRQADLANVAKSRFLAAASHDLRQPLQSLTLLQGLLAKSVDGERPQKLLARLDATLGAMSGMLNTLLDLNQIEAGGVRPELVSFPAGALIKKLEHEFSYHAQAQGLSFRTVACSAVIESDPRLLEQMLRNLLSNALKYTRRGKLLLGCRRRGGVVSIEIWDTGIGIPEDQLHAIFDEYHQVDNAARERSRGLGLGLAIVRHLGDLLGHRVRVRSRPGKGSVFAIDIAGSKAGSGLHPEPHWPAAAPGTGVGGHRHGAILVVEDDTDMSELLAMLLKEEGHRAITAHDAATALDLVERGVVRPDLILADYNLPHGMNGLELCTALRKKFRQEIPIIILTGDISTATLRHIEMQDCVGLNKPVKLDELTQAIQHLLRKAHARHEHVPHSSEASRSPDPPVIFIVDDDGHVREDIRALLEQNGHHVEDFASCEAFLDAYRPGREACLVIDAYLPGMTGLELLKRLSDDGHRLPSIMITGNSDVPIAVQAMKAGASDFIEKPISSSELLGSVGRALEQAQDSTKLSAAREDAANRLAELTPRQREILDMVLAGHPSKNIAADLGISQRTVENHRAAIMDKTGAKSLPALARFALAAAANGSGD